MYQLMLNRKNSRKGFTLVEVIVVLVILAILAAIMIPSMVKWIDKAKEKSVIVEARTVLLAAQTLASEAYAADPNTAEVGSAAVIALAGVKGTLATDPTVSGGVVTGLAYTNGKTATYANGAWTIS